MCPCPLWLCGQAGLLEPYSTSFGNEKEESDSEQGEAAAVEGPSVMGAHTFHKGKTPGSRLRGLHALFN